MLSNQEIDYLADLARLELIASEKEILRRDLEPVLAYVSELKKAPPHPADQPSFPDRELRNILRPDGRPPSGGLSIDEPLAPAPQSLDGYIKVKKIK